MTKSTNVSHTFLRQLLPSERCFNFFYLQKVGQGHGVQFSQLHVSMANVKIYKCLPQIFALTLTVSEIYKFKICDLQKIGQGHEMQFAQLHHSMGNVKIYKCLRDIFRATVAES